MPPEQVTARIDVPVGRDPREHAWSQAGAIGVAARELSSTVHLAATLPLRVFEAARARIAEINGCEICLAYRATAESNPSLGDGHAGEDFYRAVTDPTSTALTHAERLAAQFAERFALDHRSFEDDEAFWDDLHEAFSDEELIQLALSVGTFMALGRFAHVFNVDTVCELPGAPFDPPRSGQAT